MTNLLFNWKQAAETKVLYVYDARQVADSTDELIKRLKSAGTTEFAFLYSVGMGVKNAKKAKAYYVIPAGLSYADQLVPPGTTLVSLPKSDFDSAVTHLNAAVKHRISTVAPHVASRVREEAPLLLAVTRPLEGVQWLIKAVTQDPITVPRKIEQDTGAAVEHSEPRAKSGK